MSASTPYKVPVPTKENVADWQTKVNEALTGGKLAWQPFLDSTWLLIGDCPNCQHEFSEVHDLDVVVLRIKGRKPEIRESVKTEVVCRCAEEHTEGKEGCGYGRGLEIDLRFPKGGA